MSKIVLVLTDEQIEKLEPLLKKTERAAKSKKYGMLLAQILGFNDGRFVAVCGFVGHDTALEIQEAMSPTSVGRTTDQNDPQAVREAAGLPT